MICPKCGSTEVKKCGWTILNAGRRQRYYCYGHNGKFQEGETEEDSFPAVLSMDIETLPGKAYFWEVWNTNINHEMVIQDWAVCCWSAKWIGDSRVVSDCVTPAEAKEHNDKRVCLSMWKLFDEADVIIAQNGKKFDIPKLNTRWWKHKIQQPRSYKIIDTLEAARRAFGMTYNSLDYLAKYLGIGRKLKTEFELWRSCDNGDQAALDRMREYNEHDVVLLEDVYMTMRGWIPNHPDFRIYNKVEGVCPRCFGAIEDVGLYTAAKRQYKEFRCTNCGSVTHSTKPEK
jgi:hypothetical protein